jgi:hypothetical protein
MTALAHKGEREGAARSDHAAKSSARSPTATATTTAARRQMTAAALQLCKEQEFPDTTGNLTKRIRVF